MSTQGCENAGYSHKKGRLYCRAFNHQEARDLRAQGWTYKTIAEKLGTTVISVTNACDPVARAKNYAKAAAYTREHSRAACKGDCGTLVWTNQKGRSGYCRTCLGRERAQGIDVDALRCARCREWKVDEDFPRGAIKSRRLRAALCRACQTIDRKERRDRAKVPCERCGKPCLSPADKNAGGRRATPFCAACWHIESRAA